MKKTNNTFQIGSEYQDLELFLEIKDERLKGYDSYKYIPNVVNKNLNNIQYDIELIYYWEILEAVIIATDIQIEFNGNTIINKVESQNTIYYVYSRTNKLNYKILLSLLC